MAVGSARYLLSCLAEPRVHHLWPPLLTLLCSLLALCSSCPSLQAVLEQREEFGKRVVRKVPVEWIGVASEVKIMGDFDDWTRGHDLSAEDVTTDSVYSR